MWPTSYCPSINMRPVKVYIEYMPTTFIVFYCKQKFTSMISDLQHDINEICTLLGFYAAQTGSSVSTFRDLTHEERHDRLSQYVGTKLPFCAA